MHTICTYIRFKENVIKTRSFPLQYVLAQRKIYFPIFHLLLLLNCWPGVLNDFSVIITTHQQRNVLNVTNMQHTHTFSIFYNAATFHILYKYEQHFPVIVGGETCIVHTPYYGKLFPLPIAHTDADILATYTYMKYNKIVQEMTNKCGEVLSLFSPNAMLSAAAACAAAAADVCAARATF